MARVTQQTIATKLGLSASLVSRALSGKAEDIGCTPATVARIRDTARRMGYLPNAAARRLRGEGGPLLGVVAADIADPFIAQTLAGVIRRGHERGCALTVAGFERRRIHRRDLEILLEQNLSGLLLIGGGNENDYGVVEQHGIPVVRIGAIAPLAAFAQIGPNEEAGFRRLLSHLAKLGHRHLGLVGADQTVHRERLQRVRKLAPAYRMRIAPHHVVFGSDEVLKAGMEGGLRLVREAGTNRPTAVVCSSDTVALGVIGALRAEGLNTPADVSVTGFDDLLLSGLATPPLTTLHQPVEVFTAFALDALLGGHPLPRIKRFPVELMVRGSTGKASS